MLLLLVRVYELIEASLLSYHCDVVAIEEQSAEGKQSINQVEGCVFVIACKVVLLLCSGSWIESEPGSELLMLDTLTLVAC